MAASRRRAIHRISLEKILPDAEDAASELLANIFQQPAIIETDVEKGTTRACIYLPHDLERAPNWRQQVGEGLKRIESCGLGGGTLSVEKLQHEDWAESW